MLSTPFLSICRCPDCRGELSQTGDDILCDSCGRRFEYRNGKPSLLPLGGDTSELERAHEGRKSLIGRLGLSFVERIFLRRHSGNTIGRMMQRATTCLEEEGALGLDIGAANRRQHPKLIGLDICYYENLDILGSAMALPFRSEVFHCVVSQDVLEHTPEPWTVFREMARVMAPGAVLFLQVPWMFAHHTAKDYYRFSQDGIKALCEQSGLEVLEITSSTGAAFAVYHVGVEFCAAMGGLVGLYKPAKLLAAIGLLPIRILDGLLRRPGPRNRACSDICLLARKE